MHGAKRLEKGHVLLNMSEVHLCVCGGEVEGETGEDVVVQRSVWMEAHTISRKEILVTVQQASELGDYTKPSTGQVSTSKK